mmetsp:Transcript_89064/g.232219  ORF Transcript_89064/g.232219 Transcript_89064/m.232219 type:complete len:249 (+) Transcript_89064:27-773(+)
MRPSARTRLPLQARALRWRGRPPSRAAARSATTRRAWGRRGARQGTRRRATPRHRSLRMIIEKEDKVGIEDAAEHSPLAAVMVEITSFGYQTGHGIPAADVVFSARHIANPDGGPKTHMTGLDARLRKEVIGCEGAQELLHEMFEDVVRRIEARRGDEGVHVAVGCERGKHRSVILAVELAALLKQKRSTQTRQISVRLCHQEEDSFHARTRREKAGGSGKAARKQRRVLRDHEEIEADLFLDSLHDA